MRGMSGSGPLGADAQMLWFGQPAHASPFPAASDSGPGQCSVDQPLVCHLRRTSSVWSYVPGSGATNFGAAFRGASKSVTWLSSMRDGDIVWALFIATYAQIFMQTVFFLFNFEIEEAQ